MKISVITISYNAASCIESTINSVIAQKYDDFEYIIVDGVSNDGTLDIIQKYDKSISHWISEPDSGIYNAMNKAVRMASGEYCIFMNAGDIFANPLVLKQVSFFLNDNFDYLCGNEISLKDEKVIDYVVAPKCITKSLLVKRSLSHQASFIKRELLLSFPYDEKLKLVSDWKFCVETLLLYKKTYRSIDVDVCKFNHDGATFAHLDLGRKERLEVFQKFFPDEYNGVSLKKQNYVAKIKNGLVRRFRWKTDFSAINKKVKTLSGYVKVMGAIGIVPMLGKLLPCKYGNLLKHYTIVNYLKKHYGYIIDENRGVAGRNISFGEKYPIWVCWWQGERMMPLVPKVCLESLRQNLLQDQELIVISSHNYRDYVEIPDYIIKMLDSNRISITYFSDILRFSLLSKYGGLWIDSTCLVTQKMMNLRNLQFFTSKQQYLSADSQYVSAFRWASYLIGGNTLCIFQNMRDLFFAYCKNQNVVLDYLLVDYLLVVIYELCPEAKQIIDEFPYDQGDILQLSRLMNESYSDSMIWKLPIHKLSWRTKYEPYTKNGELTNFGKLIETLTF